MIFVIAAALIALIFSLWRASVVLEKPSGSQKMQDIAKSIHDGSNAYLNRQGKTILVFAVVIAAGLYFALGSVTAISFIIGAFLSGLAGYIGMAISVRANLRTAEAANRSLGEALKTAFYGGSVAGFSIVGLGLLGTSILYLMYGNPNLIIGFAFGASLISLFMRVGGGIYTKAADVGADLVGKVEKGIPEDDPRNPAVIADNVGDNVGDCAGMGADLFESYVVTLLAAMVLANGSVFPLTVAAIGIVASIIASFFVCGMKIWRALGASIVVAAVLTAVAVFLQTGINEFIAVTTGLVSAVLITIITDYYTSRDRPPVREIVNASETAATNIIIGTAVGMRSTLLPVIVICAAIMISFMAAGVYGIALAALGLLSITGIIMSVDGFGPIADNAGGIAEMSGTPKKTREITDALDAVGNTTKATTKGIAIASAALSALALLAAFTESSGLAGIDILKAPVLVGLLIGGMLPFLFSSYLMKAVGNSANLIVKEVRRQFHELKLMKGGKPDYKTCVDISTKSALKELRIPGLIAIASPIIVGFILGEAALGALLAGSIITGFVLALTLANAGAAWDNTKKAIEAKGQKGSDLHKAAVVGDTVGDPMKDTAGPAINALIKVFGTLSILIASIL